MKLTHNEDVYPHVSLSKLLNLFLLNLLLFSHGRLSKMPLCLEQVPDICALGLTSDSDIHAKCVCCHRGTARPQVANGE
jgi:hypothetical protein